jgi:hypothetical protein
MNTTTQGDLLERSAYSALRKALREERLCVSPKSAKLFKKRSYFSRDRNANIVTDISIEVYLPQRRHPSLVWVFECKSSVRSISVDDIEEFHAKLQQIGEDNTKGTIVTDGSLQSGATNYAISKGIGVIRLVPPGDQLVHYIERNPKEVAHSLFARLRQLLASIRSEPSEFARLVGEQDGHMCTNWNSVLRYGLSSEMTV